MSFICLAVVRTKQLRVERSAYFLDDLDGGELIRPNLIQPYADAQPQSTVEVHGAPQQHSNLGPLRRIQFVQRAVIAPPTVVRRVMAKPGVAQLITAQGPVNQESQGGLIRPLPAGQFGSAVSWKAASMASMAAFTATAWWVMGTSPA